LVIFSLVSPSFSFQSPCNLPSPEPELDLGFEHADNKSKTHTRPNPIFWCESLEEDILIAIKIEKHPDRGGML